MSGRYACNLFHLVWSTNQRREWIAPDWENRLHAFLGGIARNKKSHALAIGGMQDHIHMLVSLATDVSISELVNALKANSSRWIHDTFPQMSLFRWEHGYGSFSVSQLNREAVEHYIANQKEHHRKRGFKEEFTELLRKHNIEFDPEQI